MHRHENPQCQGAVNPPGTREVTQDGNTSLPPDSVVESSHDYAVEWLNQQEGAISGQGGHNRTFAVACGLAELGFGLEQVHRLLADHFNPRCRPPWSDAELWHKAREAVLKAGSPSLPEQARLSTDTRLKAQQRGGWRRYIEFEITRVGIHQAMEHLSEVRKIHPHGICRAFAWGILGFGYYHKDGYRIPFWAVGTPDGRLVEARRLDGKPWENGAKAKKLKGSEGALIGEHLLGSNLAPVLVVEGGPDLLCACYIASEAMRAGASRWAPLAILGASNHFHQPLHQSALAKLAGRKVRIFADSDEAGRKAARVWCAQLRAAGADDEVIFAGDVVAGAKDLNDVMRSEPQTVADFIKEMIQ